MNARLAYAVIAVTLLAVCAMVAHYMLASDALRVIAGILFFVVAMIIALFAAVP